MEHVSKIPVDSPQIGRDYIRRCLMRKTKWFTMLHNFLLKLNVKWLHDPSVCPGAIRKAV